MMSRVGPWRWAILAVGAISAAGCFSDAEPQAGASRNFAGQTLTVAAVGDPAAVSAVRSWKTTWERDTQATLQIMGNAVAPEDLGAADVVVFPGDRLGDLVDAKGLVFLLDKDIRAGASLDNEAAPADPLAFADILPVFREGVSRYGDDRIGLPLGGTGLVLVYRRDAFDSPAHKTAAEAKGITLAAPKTWEDLDALVAFFHTQTGQGIAVPLGEDEEGVGDAILLARAACLGLHPDHYALLFHPDTLKPRIDSPPFVEALAGFAKWKDFAPEQAATFDAEAARKAFRDGKATFLIDFAERASRWTDPKKPLSVVVAALPGSKRVYEPDRKEWQVVATPNRVPYLPKGGGLLVGITPRGDDVNRKVALDFAKALAGPDTARLLLIEPAYPLIADRNTQLSSGLPDPRSALGVDARSWGVAVAQTLTAPRVLPGLRIPRADLYLAALTQARRAAVAGASAESALGEASAAWSAISEKQGVARQLWHYRRSLNTLVTDPEPPSSSAK